MSEELCKICKYKVACAMINGIPIDPEFGPVMSVDCYKVQVEAYERRQIVDKQTQMVKDGKLLFISSERIAFGQELRDYHQ